DLVYRHFLIGVHLEELANTFFLLLGRVQQLRTGSCLTGVHADEVELTEERVCSNLEGKSRERLVFRRLANQFDLFVLRIVTDHGLDVEWRRKVIDDSIEHRLNATVLES